MKTKVLIIEDNFYKTFTTKQVLEAQLKLDVRTVEVATSAELVQATVAAGADVILCRPSGGVADLLAKLQKRQANRRNTEVTLVCVHETEDDLLARFQTYLASAA